jgi:hypothetical protein
MSSRNVQLWLDQRFPVSYEDVLARRTYIPVFAQQLSLLLKGRGYVMDSRWGGAAVARWIYRIHCANAYRYPALLHRNMPEDKDQYLDTITDELLDEFLAEWKHIPDFNGETRLGRIVRDELQQFLWAYIDIDESAQGMIVISWLDGSDTESDGGSGKVDVYIQDVDAGWHKSLR